MSDSDEFIIDGRPVPELKVIELRKELEQRSLPKSGNKKELVERLLNYLRDERVEQDKNRQQQQQQSPNQQRSPTKSPPAAVPNVVAQYLAQQQIQLEAAKRDADKIRGASSSASEDSGSPRKEQMVQASDEQQTQPPAGDQPKQEGTAVKTAVETSPLKKSEAEANQAEFIPEEPRAGEKMDESAEKEDQEPLASEEAKAQEESESDVEEGAKAEEVDASESSSSDERADEEGQDDVKEGEESIDMEEEPMDQEMVEQRDNDKPQPKEEIVLEGQQVQMGQEAEEEVAKEEDTSGEFVPEEPGAPKEEEEKLTVRKAKDASGSPVNESSVDEKQPTEEEELVFEQEDVEDDEDEPPDDDGGKRRRRGKVGGRFSPPPTPEHQTSSAKKGQLAPQLQDNRVTSATSVSLLDTTGNDATAEENADKDAPSATAVSAIAGTAEEAVEVVANEKPPVQIASSIGGECRGTLSSMSPADDAAAAGIQEESSKPPAEQEPEITPEGFVRRRASSPARNALTRWIHIRNLKRPYTQRALIDLLGKFGTVDEDAFWIDSIKSNCIVTFETSEQAQQARERLHNVIWPPAGGEALCVEFSTEEKLNRRKAEEEQDQMVSNAGLNAGLGLKIVIDNRAQQESMPAGPGPQVLVQHDKELQRQAESRKRKAEELEKSQNTLDLLFKKTLTQPSIYYLPLTDDQVTAKRPKKALSTSHTAKHSNHHRSHSNSKSAAATATNNSHHPHSSSYREREREREKDRERRHQRYDAAPPPSSGQRAGGGDRTGRDNRQYRSSRR